MPISKTVDSLKEALNELPPLREVIRTHGLRAEKSLGQNFLLDQNLTDKIVRVCGDLSETHVFEIGPGPGGLTRSILRAGAKNVIAIEFDSRAVMALQDLKQAANGRLHVVHGDALCTDLTQLAPDLGRRAIIANLPYNIATPLLIKWLKKIRQSTDLFDSMTLMFQKEVAQRIVAQPKSKAYGRLSVMAQWLCDVHITFDVPPQAFVPPPKITSSIVHFIPKNLPAGAPSFEHVEAITAAAFNQRRKMIRTSLKDYAHVFDRCGIAETSRAEDLRVEDYITLAKSGVVIS